jgi:excisionase family DNA binding protein
LTDDRQLGKIGEIDFCWNEKGVNRMAEKWISVSEACQLLQVSERTLYRKIKDEKIESRMTEDGRREVMVTMPMSKEELAEGHLKLASDTVDSQLKIVATALGSTELLTKRMQSELDFVKDELERVREHSRDEVERLQQESRQQIDYVKTEVVRARKIGILGWSVTAGLLIVLGIVAIWSVKSLADLGGVLAQAEGTVTSEKKNSNLLADMVAMKEQQISRLEGDLDAVKADLTDTKAMLTDKATAPLATRPAEANIGQVLVPVSLSTDVRAALPATNPVTSAPALPSSKINATTRPATTLPTQPTTNPVSVQ